jgi:hypothetical protein
MREGSPCRSPWRDEDVAKYRTEERLRGRGEPRTGRPVQRLRRCRVRSDHPVGPGQAQACRTPRLDGLRWRRASPRAGDRPALVGPAGTAAVLSPRGPPVPVRRAARLPRPYAADTPSPRVMSAAPRAERLSSGTRVGRVGPARASGGAAMNEAAIADHGIIRRPADRRAGQYRRLGGLVQLPPLRLAECVRRSSRSRAGRPLPGAARRRAVPDPARRRPSRAGPDRGR